MKPVFDIDTQYQLTDEDRATGWTVKVETDRIVYFLNDQVHNPSPDQPAWREWHKNGQLRMDAYHQEDWRHDPAPGRPAVREWHEGGQLLCEYYYQNGKLHDPFPAQSAYIEWWPNGAQRAVEYWTDGKFISRTYWLKDGRQKDLIPE